MLQVKLRRDLGGDLNMMKSSADCDLSRSCQCVISHCRPPLHLRIHCNGISLCHNLMKRTYHHYSIIKIMNKGHNQLKDPTIIRLTIDVNLLDYVRNAHLDYLLNIMIAATNQNNSSQFEKQLLHSCFTLISLIV